MFIKHLLHAAYHYQRAHVTEIVFQNTELWRILKGGYFHKYWAKYMHYTQMETLSVRYKFLMTVTWGIMCSECNAELVTTGS